MRKGKSMFRNAGAGRVAWMILVSLSTIACASDSAEPVSAKKPKSAGRLAEGAQSRHYHPQGVRRS